MKPVCVALTGGIGAGKSTAAEFLRQRGAHVVSGDELGRLVLDEDEAVRAEVFSTLGPSVRDATGSLIRSLIAARVFADSELWSWLTNLTFPGIYRRWRHAVESSTSAVCVFDAALIFEWKIEREFDLVLLVVADREVALQRSSSRFDSHDFDRRSARQLPVEYKLTRAHAVIFNNGTRNDLESEVDRVWQNHISPLIA